jgi:hypothetical protein
MKPDVHVLNLLSVIHSDGGHYISEYGVERASIDAMAIVVDTRAALTQATADLKAVREERDALKKKVRTSWKNSRVRQALRNKIKAENKTRVDWSNLVAQRDDALAQRDDALAQAVAMALWIRSCGHGANAEYSHAADCEGCRLLKSSDDGASLLAQRDQEIADLTMIFNQHHARTAETIHASKNSDRSTGGGFERNRSR